MEIIENKLLMFGAGKIGRSFIGQLFSMGGFEVVFVDVFKPIIEELNKKRSYRIIIKTDEERIVSVNNVRGILADDKTGVTDEVATAGILAVSVGQNNLLPVLDLIAGGLKKRYEIFPNKPLDIIIAENMRDADIFFKDQLSKRLPSDYPFDQLVGLVETSIGKMVPIMQKKDINEDILQIFAEPYNTLILSKNSFKNPIPDIKGLAPKENMKAWVDRKLFIHNLGHAATAYLGYIQNPDFIFLYEALASPGLQNSVKEVMLQAADILVKKYPYEFTLKDLHEHVDDLLNRFSNKALGDTIFRVGCDLPRKLAAGDRIAGTIEAAIDLKLPYDKILHVLVSACYFQAGDENGRMLGVDIDFLKTFKKHGIRKILKEICGFDEVINKEVFIKAEAMEALLI